MVQREPNNIEGAAGERPRRIESLRSFLLDQVSDAIFVVDENGRFVLVNEAAWKISGFTNKELVSMSLFEFLPPGEIEHAREALKKLFVRPGPLTFQSAHRRRDGTTFPVELKLSSVKYDGHKVVLGVARDLTERERAREELEAEREQYRALVEQTSDWVWEVDTEVRYTYASPQVREILGYTSEEVLGKTPFDLMPAAEAERIGAIFESIAASRERVYLLHNMNRHKDGHLVALETSGAPIISPTGEFQGYRGIDRDITERRRRGELNEGLNEINAAISSTLDIDKMLAAVIDKAVGSLHCEAAAVVLREDAGWTIRLAQGDPDITPGAPARRSLRRLVVRAEKRADLLVTRRGVHTFLTAPLIAKDKPLGALCFYNHRAPIDFSEAEIDFVRKLGSAVSLAVENTKLYQTQRGIADTLQEALLTLPARIPGIRFGTLYRSATEAARVGGDFYDLFELERGRVGIVIGDVSGKGIEAASLTSLVKNTILAYAHESLSPAEVLKRANNIVTKVSLPQEFVTVFFGILDVGSGRLIYCNAGHPPAFLRQESGGIKPLVTRSAAIGIFGGFDYTERSIGLTPGDRLVLYTDGVIEARRGPELFGEARLVGLVGRTSSDAEALPRTIYSAVEAFSGHKFPDDVAIEAVELAA